MNKSIVFFLAFFVCFSSIYAFDIYNSNNEISQYFSINNDEIKIISENLNENLIINYKINDRDYNKSYNFENINNQNQVIFKLSELNQIQEGQLTTASSYKLKVGNQEKIIYIDFKKPEFNLLETNLTNGEVNFKFNYSDELSGIKNIDLYINKNNQKIYITNLKDKTEYTYKLTEIGIYEFTFRTYDNVENYIEIKKKINVTDFFAPKISELFIEKSETNKYQLHLKVTDDVEIDSYHLKQGNLDLTENINEKVLDKKIGLPFLTTELIKLIVVDSSGNKIEKTIDLSKTIKINNFLKYINEKKIEFTTNSDKCNLISVNSNNINKEFEKDNSKFELRTSKLSSNEPNNIMFSCEKDGFREYFEKELIYDIKDPEKITINAEKTEKGSIYLDWEKSEDESGVEYEIYRNDKKQETTDSTNYEDFDVEYPNKYEYFVKVIDGAGNSIESNKIEQSPKKVKIYFKDFIENKIETNESKFVYDFETELGITLTVKQLFDNMIINEKKIEIKNKKNKFEFDLEVGENEIEINGEDYVGNKLLIKKTIIYENKLIVLDKKQDNQILLENKENEENNIIQNEKSRDLSTTLFIILIIIMILILLAFLYNGKSVGELKEKIIKEKVNKILNQKNNKKTKKFHPKIIHTEKFHIDIKRDKDKELAKKLKEIKISRNEKIRERKNPKPIKIKKELSDLNKRKLKEISKPKIFDNNFFIQKTEKPNIVRQKNSPSLEKEEKIIQEKPIKKNQFTQDFFKKKDERIIDKIRENKSRNSPTLEKKSRTFEKISERKRNDDLTSYIEKFRSKLSWDSPKDYLLSEQIKIQKLKEEKELAKIRAKEEELKAKEAKEFIKKQAELEKQLKLEKEAFEKEKKEQEKQKAKEILDDYLSKKSRKRKGFFAEKQVLRDLKNREQKN